MKKRIFLLFLACLILFTSCKNAGFSEQTTEQTDAKRPYYDDDDSYEDYYDLAGYEDFKKNTEQHPAHFASFETLNLFGFSFESLQVLHGLEKYWYTCDRGRVEIEVRPKRDLSGTIVQIPLDCLGDNLYRLPEEICKTYLCTDQDYLTIGCVQVGNAIYEYSEADGAILAIHLFVNDREVIIHNHLDSGVLTGLAQDNLVLSNLLQKNTAPEQIDQIIAAWEGKW